MRLAKGTIWQELRRRCLEAVPSTSSAPFTAPQPLSAWRLKGYYTVRNVTPSAITIINAGDGFGTALLSDAELLLDHAAEHHSSLFQVTTDNRWLSPAWVVVTTYYWGFFSALALTRLLGETIWYLDKRGVDDFKSLARATVKGLGAGPFQVKCQAYINATEREITLHRQKDRVHEAVWKQTMQSLGSAAKMNSTNIAEKELYDAIAAATTQLGPEWPSEIRNIVNYRPGFAYKEVLGKGDIDLVPYLRRTKRLAIGDIVDAFRRTLHSMDPRSKVGDQPVPASRLLLLLTFLLQAIVTELHCELIDRHGLDRRWAVKRSAFFRRQGLSPQSIPWPY